MDVHVCNHSSGGEAGIGLGPRSLLVSQPSQNNEFLASERPCLEGNEAENRGRSQTSCCIHINTNRDVNAYTRVHPPPTYTHVKKNQVSHRDKKKIYVLTTLLPLGSRLKQFTFLSRQLHFSLILLVSYSADPPE